MSKSTLSTKAGVLLASLIILAGTSKAQTFGNSHIGFRVSPAVAWIKSNSSDLSGGSKFGFSYGLVTDLGFSPNYSLGTGLDIVYKGGSLSGNVKSSSGTAVRYDNTIDLKYVEVPLTLKMRTNQIGYLRYYFQFGACIGYNISATQDLKINGTSVSATDINKFNASMIIGAGVEYPINGNTALTSGLTFNNGFVNIIDDGNGTKAITNYIALNLGFLF